jgi:hypothetical protein
MASLFHDNDTSRYDILAIQEPWRNPFIATSYHPFRQHFQIIYLDHPKTRACLYVNRRIDPSTWSTSCISPDLVSIKLSHHHSDKTIHIFNVYFELGTDTLSVLSSALRDLGPQDEAIVVGDFNLHHPLWSAIHQRASPGSDITQFLTIIEDFQLHLLTVPGTPTHR